MFLGVLFANVEHNFDDARFSVVWHRLLSFDLGDKDFNALVFLAVLVFQRV